jgi:hypothetical protein
VFEALNRIEVAVAISSPPSPQAVADAFNTLKAALQADNSYAWSWHCNIAMAAVDEGFDHAGANEGAARFMSMCFGVDVKKFSEWATIAKPATTPPQAERGTPQVAEPAGCGAVGFIYNAGGDTGSNPPRAEVVWINSLPPIGSVLYTHPPKPEPLPAQPERAGAAEASRIETLLRGINEARQTADPIWRERMGAEQVREYVQRAWRILDSAVKDCRFFDAPATP